LKVGVGTAEEFAIVLSGEAVDAYRSRLTIRTFFPAMTSDGICYLWNINAASESSWCKSARKAASIAKRSPITYWAISSKKRYGIADAESSEALTDPQWPLDTIEDFVEAAYESDMLITSLDHDLVKGFRPELAEDE
jgi:enoyl reductase-like protein